MLSTPAKERNSQDVQLAYETLQFLDGIEKPSTLKATDFRSLIVNLCDMQSRFATPMALGFGSNELDMKERLPTPQPKSLLTKHNVIYKCPPELVAEERWQMFVDGDDVYCYCGGDSWEKMVEKKLLTGDDALPPKDSMWLWLPELFKVFVAEIDNPMSRRLAAAWYYTATEVNFDDGEENDNDDDDEDDDEQDDEDTAVGADSKEEPIKIVKKIPVTVNNNNNNSNSSNSSTNSTARSSANNASSSSTSTSTSSSASAKKAVSFAPAVAATVKDANDDDDDDDDEDFNPDEVEDADDDHEISDDADEDGGDVAVAKDKQEPYFKRMLMKINTQDDPAWFPWGRSPLAHMVTLLTADMADDDKGNFMRESLVMFAQGEDDDDDEDE